MSLNVANLKLKITQFLNYGIKFIIVDLSKGNDYPANYICQLPIEPKGANTTFSKTFGVEAITIAKKLLTEALDTYGDNPEFQKLIQERLKKLETRNLPLRLCVDCGAEFQPLTSRTKRCKTCAEKNQERYKRRFHAGIYD